MRSGRRRAASAPSTPRDPASTAAQQARPGSAPTSTSAASCPREEIARAADHDDPEQQQREDVEQGLRDQRPGHDGQRLAHSAEPARDDQRTRRLAEAGRKRRRHQHSDHRRRSGSPAVLSGGRAAPPCTIACHETARRTIESEKSARAISTQLGLERTSVVSTRRPRRAEREEAPARPRTSADSASPQPARTSRPARARSRAAPRRGEARATRSLRARRPG